MADDRSYISSITLPNGNPYYFKDEVARSLITSNGTFVIAWNGTGTATAGNVPAGVMAGSVTGTLAASADTLKNFYLVKSSTEVGKDIYDEYVTVMGGTSTTPTYSWEKIGDTLILLSEVVTGVTLNKLTTNVITSYTNPGTASVIGANSTFTITQPTITVTPSTTYIKAAASGGAVSTSAKDEKTVVTGYAATDTDNFLTGITVTNNLKLVTTSVTGVSGSVTASKVSAATSQTTLSGASTSSSSTTAWFKGWAVSDENLTLYGVMPTTQTTTQINIDVTAVTVPKAATAKTTVATGGLATDGSGSAVVTNVTSNSAAALTDLGSPSTAKVLGSSATFKISTNQTVSLSTDSASATGRVQVATGISSAEATSGNVAWNSKDAKTVLTSLGTANTASVLNNSTTLTVTKGGA